MRTPAPGFMLASFLASALPAGSALAADTYEVSKTDATAVVGEKAHATFTIQGKNGWHVNEEAPITVKLLPSDGVTVDKPKLTRADLPEASKERAKVDVAFTASAPGAHTIGAEASFVMCQASACQPVKEKVTLALSASPPPSAAAPSKKAGGANKKPKR
jgi:hypothetical protein